jgi:hypothetical protein
MQGLATWIARRLNQMTGRSGRVFADRFHAHVLPTPLEVARAVAYVLGNLCVHALRRGAKVEELALRANDPYSSAGREGAAFTVGPRTWLLREGWRRARSRAQVAERPSAFATASRRRMNAF